MLRCGWRFDLTANMQRLRLWERSVARRTLSWYINSDSTGNENTFGGVGMTHVRGHKGDLWNELQNGVGEMDAGSCDLGTC